MLKKQASFLAALLMLGIDYIMEPVAIASDFWNWNGTIVPLWNYICWFLIAWILQIILKRGIFVESNKVFNLVFIILTVFFFVKFILIMFLIGPLVLIVSFFGMEFMAWFTSISCMVACGFFTETIINRSQGFLSAMMSSSLFMLFRPGF